MNIQIKSLFKKKKKKYAKLIQNNNDDDDDGGGKARNMTTKKNLFQFFKQTKNVKTEILSTRRINCQFV